MLEIMFSLYPCKGMIDNKIDIFGIYSGYHTITNNVICKNVSSLEDNIRI